MAASYRLTFCRAKRIIRALTATACGIIKATRFQAPVAQLDRVSGYEPEGRRFESFRARQKSERPSIAVAFFMALGIRTSDIHVGSTISPGAKLNVAAQRRRPRRGGGQDARSNPSGRAKKMKRSSIADGLFLACPRHSCHPEARVVPRHSRHPGSRKA